MTDDISRYINDIFSGELHQLVRKYDGIYYKIQFFLIDTEGTVCACYWKPIPALVKEGQSMVRYQNLDNPPTVNLETFSSNSQPFLKTMDILKKYAKSKMPVIITGQPGSIKDNYAHALYRFSGHTHKPLMIIDCTRYTPKRWAAIMESENSPLGESDCTVYFKDIHLLSADLQTDLENFFKNTMIHKRNRLIFSHVPGASVDFDQGRLYYYIRNTMQSLDLFIPTLNECAEDIPNLVTLYLSQMNTNTTNQVIGMQPGALAALKEFDWEHNLDQFIRVMQELMTLTNSAYVSEELTREVLQKEKTRLPTQAGGVEINLDGTLNEIINQLVKIVLKQENMNQSKAAQRLGISRSTLWRRVH